MDKLRVIGPNTNISVCICIPKSYWKKLAPNDSQIGIQHDDSSPALSDQFLNPHGRNSPPALMMTRLIQHIAPKTAAGLPVFNEGPFAVSKHRGTNVQAESSNKACKPDWYSRVWNISGTAIAGRFLPGPKPFRGNFAPKIFLKMRGNKRGHGGGFCAQIHG